MAPLDKTSPGYWSGLWSASDLPPAIDLRNTTYLNRKYHEIFGDLLALTVPGGALLEIGCACSVWLPHFAKEFGLSVSGIDYSEEGCDKARKILAREGVSAEIHFADALARNTELESRFDVVVSMGVAEHFTDTAHCLTAFARFLKPGGLLITSVPNMAGWIGAAQKLVNRRVYDTHVPLDREMLRTAAQQAGLTVIHCDYVGSSDFHVCNLWGVPLHTWSGVMRRIFLKILMRVSRVIWFLEGFIRLRGGRRLAPAIVCAARTGFSAR
jgi:cyclopropane fatty-acyl-phospholipid synthase-like methyltransferase